jgi:DNA-directed RNA polymerase subunit RPC12/RpoP
METETRICQNCQKDFIIEPDDFGFYEKINVPLPTFCPECRYIRRLLDRPE